MKKTEFIKLLKEAKDTEETAVPIYLGHLSSAVFWTGIGKEEAAEMRKILEALASESKGHKETVLKLIEQAREVPGDVI